MSKKTDTSEFDAIMEGMTQALEYSEGAREGFVTHVPETVDVRAVRAKTGLTQQAFADLFGIGVSTLRQWEQGRRHPRGPARVLLRVIEREPAVVLRALSQRASDADASAADAR